MIVDGFMFGSKPLEIKYSIRKCGLCVSGLGLVPICR